MFARIFRSAACDFALAGLTLRCTGASLFSSSVIARRGHIMRPEKAVNVRQRTELASASA